MTEQEKRLKRAAEQASAKRAEAERQQAEADKRRKEEEDQAAKTMDDAKLSLAGHRKALFDKVYNVAPDDATYSPDGSAITLHGVRLSMRDPQASKGFLDIWRGDLFEIVAETDVRIDQKGVVLASASLWFCDAIDLGEFGWFQFSFRHSALVARPSRGLPNYEPFHLHANAKDTAQALSATHVVSVGAFDKVGGKEFVDGWLNAFSSALDGSPPSCPQDGRVFWRRGSHLPQARKS